MLKGKYHQQIQAMGSYRRHHVSTTSHHKEKKRDMKKKSVNEETLKANLQKRSKSKLQSLELTPLGYETGQKKVRKQIS